MLKRIILFILVIFNLAVIFYLSTPAPKVPDLINSIKSNEPGDTVQIPNVSGYYTNMSRTQVMDFYRKNYSGLLRIELNYPPEKAKEVIKDTIQSYYLQELEIPFKQSLYINGFEWENDVFTKPEMRAQNKLIYNGVVYKSKITIRTFPVSIPKRLASFFLTESVVILAFFVFKSYLKPNHA